MTTQPTRPTLDGDRSLSEEPWRTAMASSQESSASPATGAVFRGRRRRRVSCGDAGFHGPGFGFSFLGVERTRGSARVRG